MIPKIIHQIWIGDQSARPVENMKTWQEKHPDWEYMLWTEDNMPTLRAQRQFDLVSHMAGKADILRYELLERYGGFYADADTRCLEPLEDFMLDQDSFGCFENETAVPGLICNTYIGACKGNRLMNILTTYIENMPDDDLMLYKTRGSWQIVGPLLLTRMISLFNYSTYKVYPSHLFLPTHHTGHQYKGTDKIYAEHDWGSTGKGNQ